MARLDSGPTAAPAGLSGLPAVRMTSTAPRTTGFAMLEVMIAIVLLSIGLIGMAGLQAKITAGQTESYQRIQALLLAQDMADRLIANKVHASSYVRDDYGLGPGAPCAGPPGYEADACGWGEAIRGASERSGSVNAGTLLGGRGCIVMPAANQYHVIVVWQGLVPTEAPRVSCGRDGYGIDAYRRAVVVPILLATLAGN